MGNELTGLAKALVGMGVVLCVIGGALWIASRMGGLPKLPGDLLVRKDNFTLYAPFGLMLLVSLVLTVLLNLFFRR